MSVGISNKCFPPAQRCINCERKGHDERPTRYGNPSKEYKRCSECRLMTYCDKDCQLDHWLRIHKHHCRFLSGKKHLNNSRHNPLTCALCIEDRKSTTEEVESIKSPKMFCYIEEGVNWMRTGIGRSFGFHCEGKTCDCSEDVLWPGQLPFSLGEVSGKYIGDGRDEMIAHALKLAVAIKMKDKMENVKEETRNLIFCLNQGRMDMWTDLLVCGKVLSEPTCHNEMLDTAMENLKRYLGATNPWWMALRFSLDVFVSIGIYGNRALQPANCQEYSKFTTLKKVIEFDGSQYDNIIFALENNLLRHFKVFPKIVAKSLVLLLPNDLRCQACNKKVEGQFSLKDDEKPKYPQWHPSIGKNGSCKVYCSSLKNPNCLQDEYDRNVVLRLRCNADQWKIYDDELSEYISRSRMCDECSKRSISTHRCTGCLAVQYCSTECQKKDLDFHKQVCSNWAKDESKKLGSSREQKKYWKSVADNAPRE